MPVVEGLHQPPRPRPRPAHDQNMHDLMTGAINIECPGIPPFRDPGRVDCRSGEIQQAQAHEIRHRLLRILQCPAVDKYPVGDRDEGGQAEERIHSYADGAIHRASEFRAHGEYCTAQGCDGCLHKS